VLVRGKDLGEQATRLFRVLVTRARRHRTPNAVIGYWAGVEAGSRISLN
jgi:hypothetical protein